MLHLLKKTKVYKELWQQTRKRQNNSSTKETKQRKNLQNYDPDITNNNTYTTVKTETWQAADATLNIREHQAIQQDQSIIKSDPRA